MPLQTATAVSAEQALAVGVVVFDPGLQHVAEEDTSAPAIRKAESVYMARHLARTMEKTGAWGAVRVIPNAEVIVDVVVQGTIVKSDGTELSVDIVAQDSAGQTWLKKRYSEDSASSSYYPANTQDPFQNIYNRIANDLMKERNDLATGRGKELQLISDIRFAREFSPQAFSSHLEEKRNGSYELTRLPAANDPIFERVARIRERDYLFIDTLDEYYDSFSRDMGESYQQYRAQSFEEMMAKRELEAQARMRMVVGVATVLAGVAAASAGDQSINAMTGIAIAGGGMIFNDGLNKRREASMHAQALDELSLSLSEDIQPHVVSLDDRTVTLTGTVEQQYAQWKELLLRIYEQERGTI
ncbi:MAG: hypothetical protein V7711_13560 [Pseudomonadales bacterium]